MLLYARGAASKPRNRRSTFGCVYCKEKRKKCDEKRPQCARCAQYGQPCIYKQVVRADAQQTIHASVDSSLSVYDVSNDSSVFECHSNVPNKCWYDSRTQQGSPSSFSEWENVSEYRTSNLDMLPDEWRCLNQELGTLVQSSIPSSESSNRDHLFEFAGQYHRQVLTDHFFNVLLNLIIFGEDAISFFYQATLPISNGCSPMLDALLAFSSAHLEYKGVENEETSLYFHNKALHGLSNLIDPIKEANKEAVLGTIMLLLYYEVLAQQTKRSIVNGHLTAAIMVIRSISEPSTPESISLERSLCFYDIIAAFSFDQLPHSTTQPLDTPVIFQDLPEPFSHPLAPLDSLLGFCNSLMPVLHRLSRLRSVKAAIDEAFVDGNSSKSAVLKSEFESESQGIKLALLSWRCMVLRDRGHSDPNEEAKLKSIMHNADAYRHSALVYLYREAYFYPQAHPLVQKHLHLSLLACRDSIELSRQYYDGPTLALLWPAFIVSCDAITKDDRDMASMAFIAMDKRRGMKNISDAWEVLREVWRRTDLVLLNGGRGVYWRDICQEKGLDIVFV